MRKISKFLSIILGIAMLFSVVIVPSASASEEAVLADLVFDGYSVPGFSAATTTYNVTLPYRHYVSAEKRYIPEVSAKAMVGGSYTVGVPSYDESTKTGTVTVTAKKAGLTDKVYTINYTVVGDNLLPDPSFEKCTGSRVTTDGWGTKYNDKLINGFASHGDKSVMMEASGQGLSYKVSALPVDWVYLTAADVLIDDAKYVNKLGFVMYNYDILNVNNVKAEKHYIDAVNKWTQIADAIVIDDATNPYYPNVAFCSVLTDDSVDGATKYYYDNCYVGAMVAGDVKIAGVPDSTITSEGTINLSATVVNQLGTTEGITQPTVSWKLVEAPEDVIFDETTGALSIPETCAGKIVVEATAVPNWGTAEQKASQTIIGERIELIAAVNAPATVTYQANESVITPTVNWFNASQDSKIVCVYTALYETVEGKETLKDIVVNDAVTVESCKTYNVALKPITLLSGCKIRSFVLTDSLVPVMASVPYIE